MVRQPLTPEQIAAGKRLGQLLRQLRADRSLEDIAMAAGISPETLRKIESGRLPSPAFGTVVSLAEALETEIGQLALAWKGVAIECPCGATGHRPVRPRPNRGRGSIAGLPGQGR